MNNILATTSSFGRDATHLPTLLAQTGLNLVTNPFGRKLKESELSDLLAEYRPIGLLAGTESIGAAVIEQAKDFLKVISRVGVGWDNIDHVTANRLGLKVFRTEGVLDQAVAELTLGFMLAALRGILIQDESVRRGVWEKRMGGLLQGKTVGVIGFGAIGRRVGELAHAFGCRVLYADIVSRDVSFAEQASKERLLAESDVVTLHVSGSAVILDEDDLNLRIKNGAIVINTARGGLLNEAGLEKALNSGRVAFACLDVFEKEPYCGTLAKLENVILTPHIGSYAREARTKMEEMAVENLLKGLGHYDK